jgi:hypothetical protein
VRPEGVLDVRRLEREAGDEKDDDDAARLRDWKVAGFGRSQLFVSLIDLKQKKKKRKKKGGEREVRALLVGGGYTQYAVVCRRRRRYGQGVEEKEGGRGGEGRHAPLCPATAKPSRT